MCPDNYVPRVNLINTRFNLHLIYFNLRVESFSSWVRREDAAVLCKTLRCFPDNHTPPPSLKRKEDSLAGRVSVRGVIEYAAALYASKLGLASPVY